MALTVQRMAAVRLDGAGLRAYLADVFPEPQDSQSEALWARIRSNRAWAEYFFTQGKGNQTTGARGTLSAAYNSVVELVDHRAGPRRLQSACFGSGYTTKARAFEHATARLGLAA
jgi:hypothetical protein